RPPPPPIFTLFPYTTLFRSYVRRWAGICQSRHKEFSQFLRRPRAPRYTIVSQRRRSILRGRRRRPRNMEPIIGQGAADAEGLIRSEEHTSELQSRENLVCRL